MRLLPACAFFGLASSAFAAEDWKLVLPPTQVRAGGKPIDVGRVGHAAPFMADLDGDGRPDLVVGEFALGRVRVYKNVGKARAPKFDTYDPILASGVPASIPAGCRMGFTPHVADLTGTGRGDLISGSKPGDLYLFRRLSDGGFASPEKLRDTSGKSIDAWVETTVFAFDWDGDGKTDLVIGRFDGEVHVALNAGGAELRFHPPRPILTADGKPVFVPSWCAPPIVADWDSDGKPDLIVGAEDGSVVWFRNVGEKGRPVLEPARELIPKSPLGHGRDDERKPGEWGVYVKPCAVDWDGDGRLDLLVGDRCGSFEGKPVLSPGEREDEQKADADLPRLRAEWAATFKAYRETSDALPGESVEARATRLERADRGRAKLTRLKNEIAHEQQVKDDHRPRSQSHGFVWLFMREPAAGKTTPRKDR